MRIFKKDYLKQNRPPSEYPAQPLEEISDATLIDEIVNGTIWAMEALYQRYYRMLFSFVYRIVADQQVAEDLLQEAFLAAWRNASSYSSQSGEVRSWLISIIHHRAIDYLRSLQRRAALNKIPLDEVEFDLRAASPDVWDEAWQSVQRFQVREALMSLPKEQRMVIELAYFQGWTHSEIAEGCRLPLGTVKARMRLGLLRLKHILEQKGINGS